jgi:hypothetical protein
MRRSVNGAGVPELSPVTLGKTLNFSGFAALASGAMVLSL